MAVMRETLPSSSHLLNVALGSSAEIPFINDAVVILKKHELAE